MFRPKLTNSSNKRFDDKKIFLFSLFFEKNEYLHRGLIRMNEVCRIRTLDLQISMYCILQQESVNFQSTNFPLFSPIFE